MVVDEQLVAMSLLATAEAPTSPMSSMTEEPQRVEAIVEDVDDEVIGEES